MNLGKYAEQLYKIHGRLTKLRRIALSGRLQVER